MILIPSFAIKCIHRPLNRKEAYLITVSPRQEASQLLESKGKSPTRSALEPTSEFFGSAQVRMDPEFQTLLIT